MTTGIHDWRQHGRIYVWRYDRLSRNRRGWHFTADPLGAASIVELIGIMKANGVASYRTLHVGPVQEAIWCVPNFGPPARDRFERLRLEYEPGYEMLTMTTDGDRLTLHLGYDRADALIAAFEDVAIGLGDFGIGTSNDRRADTWMFWWMLSSATANPGK